MSVSDIKREVRAETGLTGPPTTPSIVKIDVNDEVDSIKLTIKRDNSLEKLRQLKQDLSLPLQTIQLDKVVKTDKNQEIIRTEETARSGSCEWNDSVFLHFTVYENV